MPYTKWNFREIGDNVTIYEPVAIIRPEAMILKNHVLISEFAYLAGGMGLGIGNFIHISTHCSILGGGYCILEDFVAVSAGSRLITGTEDITGAAISLPTVPPKYRSFFRSYVHVEKFAFLATGVIVHPGVTIGEGSVVGSGSIVTKDLEPWGIYIGAPAKKVRDRPKEKILSLANQLMDEYHLSYSDFSMLLPQK